MVRSEMRMVTFPNPKPEGRRPKETRRPKAEGRKKPETRFAATARQRLDSANNSALPKSQGCAAGPLSDFGFRISVFFRISAFGLRPSAIGLGIALLVVIPPPPVQAQSTAAPRTQDPLMQLMLSQPKIDMDSPVVPVASFDPPMAKPGEVSIYRVTLNALETAVEWPDKVLAPSALSCRPSAHGQVLSMAGPLLAPRTTFNYRVRCSETGQFTIPEFSVRVNGKSVAIPAARLEIAAIVPPDVPTAQQLLLDLPTNALFVGQTVSARVLLPGSPGGMVQSLGQVQINGNGFIVDQSSAHARIEALALGTNRRGLNTFVYELNLTPIATGKLSISAQGYAVGNRVIGNIIMPGVGAMGAQPQFLLVDSDLVTLEVRPLPRASELPGFTGAVGNYSVDPPELATNILSVGEPVKLKVRVRGEGNLARLVPPPAPQVRDWQVFSSPSENTAPQILLAQGFVVFNYVLIPLTEKARTTPAFPFCAFNPDRGTYEDLTVPSLAVTVLPGTVSAADLQAVIQAEKTAGDSEKQPSLSALATSPGLAGGLVPVQMRPWFPLIHLVPASALFGFWYWDRRRRFLEQHPDIVLRRRALRALRRERRTLSRAAQTRDATGFAAVAVKAMKIAVAPHFPAEPRALVGADVMTMLSADQRLGRSAQIVRHLFSRADASRFGAVPVDSGELLNLRPEIEAVLDQLEARLCH